MSLPLDLQGDPVAFYHQMKAKKKQSPHKTETDSDCTPEKTLERKSSAKGHNQRKKSSCLVTETSKGDKSTVHVSSPDNQSPEHKVPKHEESDLSLTDKCDSIISESNTESVISSNVDAVQSCDSADNKVDSGAQLNNAENVHLNTVESGDCSYHASENLNSKLSTEKKTTSGLARWLNFVKERYIKKDMTTARTLM